MIPESIVGWMFLEMMEIIGLLHRVGIAHNNLGLESFLVASDGTTWTLLLNGLGSKSSVQSGDNLELHMRHDMLSLAFITWSILMGCSTFKYTIADGEIRLDGIDCIATNIFLRGRDGWKGVLSALLNCGDFQGVGLIPQASLDSIRSILRMSHSSDDETTGEKAVAAFFGSLLDMQPKAGRTIVNIQFSKALGISSEELIFNLHFSKSSPDHECSLPTQCIHNSVKALNSTAEVSRNEMTTAVTGNGNRKRDAQRTQDKRLCSNSLIIGPAASEMSDFALDSQHGLDERLHSRWRNNIEPQDKGVREPSIPMEVPTFADGGETGSDLRTLTKNRPHQRHSAASEIAGDRSVSHSIGTSEPTPKRRKMSNRFMKSRGTVESQSTNTTDGGTCGAPASAARVVEFIPAKSRKYTRRKPTAKEAQDTVRRRSCRAHLVCGIEGCKNQFPVDNGYMWVMMVGLEDQADNTSLPTVPTHHPMHLVCTSCREPNGDGMFLTKELLNEQDKTDISHWDKYLYYKASRVEYEKWLRK
jgi:hypothetical protein